MIYFLSLFCVVAFAAESTDGEFACVHDETGSCVEEDANALNLLQSQLEIHHVSAKAFNRGLQRYMAENPDPVYPPHGHAAASSAGATGSKIIVLGDSGGEFQCTDIARFCGKSKVINMATSGSRADEWAKGYCPPGGSHLLQYDREGMADLPGCDYPGATCCNSTKAFSVASKKFGTDYTHAFVSVGGNDYLQAKCPSDAGALSKIQQSVEAAIDTIRAAFPPTMKIVLWGYPVPSTKGGGLSAAEPDCGSKGPSAFGGLDKAIGKAAKAKGVEYVNTQLATGATATTWAPNGAHYDAIHLNSKGYCKVVSMPEMQSKLGCQGPPTCSLTECDKVGQAFNSKSGDCAKVSDTCSGSGPQCVDNDKGLKEAAAAVDPEVISCSGALEKYPGACTGNYASTLRDLCPVSCGACPA